MISIKFESGKGWVARCNRSGFFAIGYSESRARELMDDAKTRWIKQMEAELLTTTRPVNANSY